MTVAEILLKAADLIEPEGAWTQRAGARTADNGFCDSTDLDAVCWCAQGALYRTAGIENYTTYAKAVDAVEKQIRNTVQYVRISKWNDAPERTQAEVVAALRAAAKTVGAES